MRRSTQPRTSHTPPPISFPHKSRTSSISNTMHWLARSSTQSSSNSTSYAAPKPVRISEPKLLRSIDMISPPRTGTLGSGAIIVRTPDEALRETGVRVTYEPPDNKEELVVKAVDDKLTPSSIQQSSDEPLSPPTSPPLPPLPLPDTAEEEQEIPAPETAKMPPPRPTRTPPLTPPFQPPSRRSSLKARSIQPSQDAPAVPEVPPHFAAFAQPPPFSAILISDPPVKVDPSKTVVTLETCTTTFRTTINTINSRPSHLSNYISSLYDQSESKSVSAKSSVYSMASDDMAAYHHHLTSQGLFPRSTNIHIFLDRPSGPYKHILNYLRSSPSHYHPDILPRSLQLFTQGMESQLDNLIEVRDEAAFLNLEGLHKLCVDEIRLRYGPRFHSRDNSASSRLSIQSLQASVHSLHTVLERVEADLRNSVMPCSSDTNHPNPQETALRSPPTPQSWDGHLIQRTQQGRQSLKSPPAGWI